MTKLPVVSGAAAVRAFERLGYTVDRQKGSHIVLRQHESLTAGSSYRIIGTSLKVRCAH